MSDHLPPCLQAVTPEHVGLPFEIGPYIPMATANRIAALHYLHRGRRALDMLSDVLRNCPDHDEALETAAVALSTELTRAGDALDSFLSLRECNGSS